MKPVAARFAAAARTMIGTPFRLHGRDAGRGLDCVGVVSLALEQAGRPHDVPRGYSLRNLDHLAFWPFLLRAGFAETDHLIAQGDLIVAKPGPAQLHLLVATGPDAFVHAHAGIGRVVETPGPLDWPLLGSWRLQSD